MMAALWDRWYTFLGETFAITLSATAEEHFKLYLTLLKEWNEKFNLVSFKSDEELLWRHFADSLAGLWIINKLSAAMAALPLPLSVIDIGTGAGLPGIPVKLAQTAISLTLVESITKKCTFLEHIRQQTGTDFTIVNDRLENVGQNPAHRQQYSFVLSRAVAKLTPNLEFALPLIAVGGYLLLFKTEQSADGPDGITSVEKIITLLGGSYCDTFSYDLPDAAGGKKRYCIVVVKKIAPTPKEFPRRVGIVEKKPLLI